jgi:hypothetical protein
MHNKFAISVFALGFAALTAVACGDDNNNNNPPAGTGGISGTGGARTGGASGTGGAGTGGVSGTGGVTGTGGVSGTGGSTGDAGDAAAETGDAPMETGGGDTAAAVTWTTDIKPIFAAKCAPCHTTQNQGGHNLGASYAAAMTAAVNPVCAGLNKGQCTIVRIKSGQMPLGKNCTGNPATDASNPACLTQAEQDKVQAWIDGGLKM